MHSFVLPFATFTAVLVHLSPLNEIIVIMSNRHSFDSFDSSIMDEKAESRPFLHEYARSEGEDSIIHDNDDDEHLEAGFEKSTKQRGGRIPWTLLQGMFVLAVMSVFMATLAATRTMVSGSHSVCEDQTLGRCEHDPICGFNRCVLTRCSTYRQRDRYFVPECSLQRLAAEGECLPPEGQPGGGCGVGRTGRQLFVYRRCNLKCPY